MTMRQLTFVKHGRLEWPDVPRPRVAADTDALVRPIPWSGMLLLYGTVSLEVWTDQGLSPFPFQRSVTIPRGLAGFARKSCRRSCSSAWPPSASR